MENVERLFINKKDHYGYDFMEVKAIPIGRMPLCSKCGDILKDMTLEMIEQGEDLHVDKTMFKCLKCNTGGFVDRKHSIVRGHYMMADTLPCGKPVGKDCGCQSHKPSPEHTSQGE